MTNRFTPHYSKLSGDERFRLSLSALARGDEAEALGETCLTFHYRMKDWDFTRRNESSVWITIIVSHEINTHLAVVRFLDAQAEVASILEGFDRFATATWNMNGAEAIAADKELFAHQESYLREARDLSAHDETARRWCAALTRAWKLQLSQGQEADTA